MAYSPIKIKPSKVGSLRKLLGTKTGSKIPAAQLATKPSDSTAVKKKKVFAKNARRWNHGGSGLNKLMGG